MSILYRHQINFVQEQDDLFISSHSENLLLEVTASAGHWIPRIQDLDDDVTAFRDLLDFLEVFLTLSNVNLDGLVFLQFLRYLWLWPLHVVLKVMLLMLLQLADSTPQSL